MCALPMCDSLIDILVQQDADSETVYLEKSIQIVYIGDAYFQGTYDSIRTHAIRICIYAMYRDKLILIMFSASYLGTQTIRLYRDMDLLIKKTID